MMENYQCRVCGSNNTENLGVLPEYKYFAGSPLNPNLPKASLYRCNSCLILLRHPILTTSDYNALYEKAGSKVWSNSSADLRPDQAIVRTVILNRKSICNVLDVGCYTGDLLASLPSNYIKYGVEMSKEASAVSAARGVSIIGDDLYNIQTNNKFDIIVAMDVIEHTQNPKEFLNKLLAMLESDGEIIISTGNSDNWLWKYLKNRFWYSKFPEHISFVGERWLGKFCDSGNFIISEKYFFNYTSLTPLLVIKNIAKLIFSLMYIEPERFSCPTKDHFCFVLKAKSPSELERI